MTDSRPALVIEIEGKSIFNIVMIFRVAPYRNGVALVGADRYRNPKTNMGYKTFSGGMGSVQVYSDSCAWRYVGDSHGDRHKWGFKSFDEVKKFALNKFIQVVRSYLKSEHYLKLAREEAKQIKAYLRKGIEEMMKK